MLNFPSSLQLPSPVPQPQVNLGNKRKKKKERSPSKCSEPVCPSFEDRTVLNTCLSKQRASQRPVPPLRQEECGW